MLKMKPTTYPPQYYQEPKQLVPILQDDLIREDLLEQEQHCFVLINVYVHSIQQLYLLMPKLLQIVIEDNL